MRRWTAVLLVVAAACTSAEEEAAPPPTFEPTFEPARCTARVPDAPTVECGVLTVLEDRDDPNGPTIRLPVAIVRSEEPIPAPDPIVYFSGGPGGPGLEAAHRFHETALGADRDVIVFDQRGTGGAQPSLECPEVDEATWANFGTAAPPAEEAERTAEAYAACRARLVADGVDLGSYDTPTSADDVADLRRALGIETWNLFGVSYGTTLALEVLRSHPEGVRSVVLDSVYPTDVSGGVEDVADAWRSVRRVLLDGCAADPACAAAYPSLEADFDAAIARFDAEPFLGEIPDPATGELRPIAITGADILAGAFDALYERNLIPLLPSVAAGLARGETGIIPVLAADGIPSVTRFADAMATSVQCADRARLLRVDADEVLAEEPELSTLLAASPSPSSCAVWDVRPVREGFEEPVESDVPAFVLAGEYDPVTPPAHSRHVAETLSQSTFALFPAVGHGAVFSHECPAALFQAFVAEPESELDTSCVDTMGPPEWVVP